MEYPVVGLVGKVGCGKSTVSGVLAKEYKFIALDVDKFGHSALEWEKDNIVGNFGTGILDSTGKIDRQVLGNLVFRNAEKLSVLNSIVHPRMKKEIADIITKHPKKRYIIDAALLFEMGLDELCDYVVSVEAPEDIIRARVKLYRKWDDCKIDGVLHAQRYLDFFKDKSHFSIFNNGDMNKLMKQIEFFILEIS
ncbi:MAG: dephospho-CoA kinase [Spirochaetes bacterium GWF1_49_6]|nr:MAG: dephospho-CoA kinase [Spirochaetes bacterium GWF1_49_6]